MGGKEREVLWVGGWVCGRVGRGMSGVGERVGGGRRYEILLLRYPMS